MAKVNWAVTAFNEWREARLEFCYDAYIFDANLNDLKNLTVDNLVYALCYFIPEVTKKKTGEPYPGATLYQMIVAIQKHLRINGIRWNLVYGAEFIQVRTVLDNVMKERTEANVGTGKKRAKLVTYDVENDLWNRNFLGVDTPDKLRTTAYFCIGMGFFLHAVQEHYSLRRDMPNKKSQITFERNSRGLRCAVYREDVCTKTFSGGLNDMRLDRKEVWIHPNLNNPDRCPVMVIDKYVSLCPEFVKKENFYLQSLSKPTPACWYACEVLGEGSIGKIMGKMMAEAGYDGFYSGHSLRRTGSTRLFQAGVQRKIVKECTGHRSDAVDQYQITSEAQKETVSKILASKPSPIQTQSTSEIRQVAGNAIDPRVVCHSESKECDVDVEKKLLQLLIRRSGTHLLANIQKCQVC